MTKDSIDQSENESIEAKVASWLENEGYPLEFAVANAFRKSGFAARQGQYVRSADTKPAREIDIVASKTVQRSEHVPMMRASFIVECKWSKDKPWVVLTSAHTRMANAACAAQMISSRLAEAALWAIAGDDELHTKTNLFKSNDENGFNGRQALSKNQDQFYASMQSIVDKAYCYVNEYREANLPATMPNSGVVAFPLIVIDGILMQGAFNEIEKKVELTRKDWIRCFWSGSSSWHLATVDIVTLDGLDKFLDSRKSEIDYLLGRLVSASAEVAICCKEKSLKKLTTSKGSRGVIGLPALLSEIAEAQETASAPRDSQSLFLVVNPQEGRFRAVEEPIGFPADPFAGQDQIYLTDAPLTWLRLAPVFDQKKVWLETDIKNLIFVGGDKFISGFRPSTFRASDGFGVYAKINDDPHSTLAAVFASKAGEIWSVDTYLVEAFARERNRIPNLEPNFAKTLQGMYDFLSKLGVKEPYQWIAGIEGIQGKRLHDEEGALGGFRGSIGVSVLDKVVCRGSFDASKGSQASLEPFFTQLWDACGAKRVLR